MVGEKPRAEQVARAVRRHDPTRAAGPGPGGHHEGEVDPFRFAIDGRFKRRKVLVLPTRSATEPGRRFAFRISRSEVSVGPAAPDELPVDEAARRVVEISQDERRIWALMPGRNPIGHLHALALAHVRRTCRDALGRAVGTARPPRSIGARGEMGREDIDRAGLVLQTRQEDFAEIDVKPELLDSKDRQRGQHDFVVKLCFDIADHELVGLWADRRELCSKQIAGRPGAFLQGHDLGATPLAHEFVEEIDPVLEPTASGVGRTKKTVQEVQTRGSHGGRAVSDLAATDGAAKHQGQERVALSPPRAGRSRGLAAPKNASPIIHLCLQHPTTMPEVPPQVQPRLTGGRWPRRRDYAEGSQLPGRLVIQARMTSTPASCTSMRPSSGIATPASVEAMR